MTVNITEMALSGSISLENLAKQNITHWRTAPGTEQSLIQSPSDSVGNVTLSQGVEKIWTVSFEPQRIRTFHIHYIKPEKPKVAEAAKPATS